MDARHARLLGGAVEVAGLATVGSALVPGWQDRLPLVERFVQADAAPVAAGITAFGGIALVIVGRGVAGRRWMAWLLAVAALLIAAGTGAFRGLDPGPVRVPPRQASDLLQRPARRDRLPVRARGGTGHRRPDRRPGRVRGIRVQLRRALRTAGLAPGGARPPARRAA